MMELVPKTKYTHFRSESLSSNDDTNSNPFSLTPSTPATPLTPPGLPSSLSSSSLTPILPPSSPRRAENSPTTLCSFFPRMGALRLGISATLLPGLKVSSRPQRAQAPMGSSGGNSSSSPTPHPPPCLTAPSPPHRPPLQDMNRLGGASRRARVEGGQLGGDEWTRHGSFVNKPTRGWLHSDHVVSTTGVAYSVRYMGCVEVLQSMRALDFNTRTQVTREAISVVCEAVPGAKGAQRKRKPSSRCMTSILGKRNLQFAGMTISLTVSTSSLNLLASDCKQIIANHHMQSISFASGGDPDTAEYVAYVAKDPVNQRACHILECSEGLAQEVISTIGQAFELRFKQYLKNPPKLVTPHDRMAPFDGSAWEEEEDEGAPPPADVPYYNNFPGKQPPPGGLVDMRARPVATLPYGQPGQNDIHKQPLPPLPMGAKEGGRDLCDDPSYVNVDKPRPATAAANGNAHRDAFDMKPFDDSLGVSGLGVSAAPPLVEQLQCEAWFHGSLSRRQAERLLTRDGDFLVRESGTTPGQYVLTGQQGGQPKHLLLVDPEGVVRTKDHHFESVSHLISYHMDNRLPIVSAGSEVCLQQPVEHGA
ncbi:SHC-transforming protein 1 isoform X1 [Oncorhynchus kisutch]|uniref:SHC-transforming protein 1 n=4 Tax=Oncorhynchus TaxID=8016 RepID=A0A8C7M505_ONCKI|nr:SHC-transforming protein 1-like isoform X1 [Oncorhynchus kisutch]XP_031693180.1 SHC-transforming protein 1-like isoform X1 [Oncorhynchus kisutch]XP_031693187.1 SHC-transforming protein 1-like isoform X1 [Oncorhynchus kisutch]